MNWAAYALLIGLGVVFYELLYRLRVVADAQRMFQVAPAAVKIVSSRTLSDADKEAAVRRMSVRVLKDTLIFTGKFAGILGICLALAVVGDKLLNLPAGRLYALILSWRVLLGLLAVLLVYARLRNGQ